MDLQGQSLNITQVITGSEYVGGAEIHVRDLTFALQSLGHSCTVLVGPPDGLFCQDLRERGITVRVLPSLRKQLSPTGDAMAFAELAFVLKRAKPDIIAVHTAKASFLGRIAASMVRVPSVSTPHGWSILDRRTGKRSQVFLTLERLAGRFGTKVIAVCDYERHLAKTSQIVHAEKLAVVHNGIPDTGLISDPMLEPVTIVMVARFDPPKDHATLLQALAQLASYRWSLRLVGAGTLLPSARAMAASLGIAHRVEFLGERADVGHLLCESQIFALSSRLESFPISILEAMRAGLPVVASAVGGIPEAVLNKKTGFLVPPADPDALACSLRTLFENASLRAEMGRRARARYLERFTADRMVSETLRVYTEAISVGPSLAMRRSTASLMSTPH
jgi:glycosyltransferase involved in cell wall biosynthesis